MFLQTANFARDAKIRYNFFVNKQKRFSFTRLFIEIFIYFSELLYVKHKVILEFIVIVNK